jgi:hypothetical protein
MAEALTILAKLLTIREIQEDAGGATLHFQERGQARLPRADARYTTQLSLAWRSQERQHPVGVRFGEGQTVSEFLRADNDVPTQLLEAGSDGIQVFFQGHDGVFRLQPGHPEASRIRTLLGEAIRHKGRVWFIAQKPDLALLDVRPAGWAAG